MTTQKEKNRIKQKENTNIRFPNVDLEFIDKEDQQFFEDLHIQVRDENTGNQIKVNIITATPERWKLLREGKDSNYYTSKVTKKIIFPIISILRRDIEREENIPTSELQKVVIGQRWSKKIQYSSQNIDKYLNPNWNPQRELLIMNFPQFIKINYELGILTVHKDQMNKIIETLLSIDDEYTIKSKRGTRFTFDFNSPITDNTNLSDFSGEQRNIEFQLPFSISTEIIQDYDYKKNPTIQKQLTPLKIFDMNEREIRLI